MNYIEIKGRLINLGNACDVDRVNAAKNEKQVFGGGMLVSTKTCITPEQVIINYPVLSTCSMEGTEYYSTVIVCKSRQERDEIYETIKQFVIVKKGECQHRWKEGNLNVVCGHPLPCPRHKE